MWLCMIRSRSFTAMQVRLQELNAVDCEGLARETTEKVTTNGASFWAKFIPWLSDQYFTKKLKDRTHSVWSFRALPPACCKRERSETWWPLAYPLAIKVFLWGHVTHMISRIRPSHFSACNIEKLGVAWLARLLSEPWKLEILLATEGQTIFKYHCPSKNGSTYVQELK